MTGKQRSCCPERSWGAPLDVGHGVKSFDGAKGESLMIGPQKNLEIYLAKPDLPSPEKKAIIVFTDVYGLQSRLFAILDKLAKDLKLYVVAVDCFRGETMDNHMNDFVDWMQKHPYDTSDVDGVEDVYPVKQDIDWCFQFLQQRFSVDSSNVGAIGFCWGVWAMTKACAMGANFKCGVGFHPSIIVEDMAFDSDQLSIAKLASGNTPLLLCVAGNDSDDLKPPAGAIAQMISSSYHHATELKRQQPKCVEFPDMVHGWVSRGDTSEERVREDAEEALKIASEFLTDWM